MKAEDSHESSHWEEAAQTFTLKSHLPSHSEERPFNCDQCREEFH